PAGPPVPPLRRRLRHLLPSGRAVRRGVHRGGGGLHHRPYSSLSAGVMPGHVLDHSPVVTIGDRVLIGKGSGIVGHQSVEIGDDVFTGHHVYITDANHGYDDTTLPIGRQFAPSRPVRVGSGSWLGTAPSSCPAPTSAVTSRSAPARWSPVPCPTSVSRSATRRG